MKYLPLFVLMSLVGCSTHKREIEQKEEKKVSYTDTLMKAYEFGFPLVLMDVTREMTTNISAPDSNKIHAPINQMVHASRFPDASFKDVVTPNVDTLYSAAWLDLAKEPMILELPDTKGRYSLFPILDAYTNVYFSPGKRTTGTHAQKYVIVGPRWMGDLPQGYEVVRAPTDINWIIGRIQTNSKNDGATFVKSIQQKIKLYPMSFIGKTYVPPKHSTVKMEKMAPVDKVFNMSTEEFFNRLNILMVTNPPKAEDMKVVKSFEKYGIAPGATFTLQAPNQKEQDALKFLPLMVNTHLDKTKDDLGKWDNGWIYMKNLGTYGTNYHRRALIAQAGLGANLDADALYPMAFQDNSSEKLVGPKSYILHFNKNQIPKVNGFWSLTVYGADNFLVKNQINRFTLGDRNKLQYNKDGSLDIYLQPNTPGREYESNWLPTPQKGEFHVAMRIYWAKEEFLKSKWSLPGIEENLMPRMRQAQEEYEE